MGLTLVAVVTAALILPGVIAARFFYRASRTPEVEPSVPPLSSTDGIALIGLSSVAVHAFYVVLLLGLAALPPVVPLPLANPYGLFAADGTLRPGLDAAFALASGLVWLCALAAAMGYVAGTVAMRRADRGVFYGPLAEIIARGDGPNRFVSAYIVTKMRHEGRLIGYQGTVVSLLRDADRFPAKVVLRDASLFYLDIGGERPERRESGRLIDWLALAANDWENIAFKVFAIEDDPSVM